MRGGLCATWRRPVALALRGDVLLARAQWWRRCGPDAPVPTSAAMLLVASAVPAQPSIRWAEKAGACAARGGNEIVDVGRLTLPLGCRLR